MKQKMVETAALGAMPGSGCCFPELILSDEYLQMEGAMKNCAYLKQCQLYEKHKDSEKFQWLIESHCHGGKWEDCVLKDQHKGKKDLSPK